MKQGVHAGPVTGKGSRGLVHYLVLSGAMCVNDAVPSHQAAGLTHALSRGVETSSVEFLSVFLLSVKVLVRSPSRKQQPSLATTTFPKTTFCTSTSSFPWSDYIT